MFEGVGKPVFSGIAIGPARTWRQEQAPLPEPSGDAAAERQAFEAACETARAQLTGLYETACRELGEEQAMILEVQLLMLDDQDFLESVQARLEAGEGAARAAKATGEEFSEAFAALDDPYMKARAADVRDVSQRLVNILCGGRQEFSLPEPCILLAEDLTPSETVQLPRDKILAFVTRQGSANSHIAILARTMNIPSLVQARDLPDVEDGCPMIVDGFAGRYYLEPDGQTLSAMIRKAEEAAERRRRLEAYRGVPTVSRSGRRIKLLANIGSPDDVDAALAQDAEGVGLLRSEFLYLGRSDFPTEEELYEAYCQAARKLGDRPLVIRTLDIGADKQADYFHLPAEENPALGCRGIRLCLCREDIFRPQMRAIYRAAALRPLSAMFPMIASVEEVRRAKVFCQKIRQELADEGVPFGEVELGVMIETPAAALISAELAKEVQFFSVGTNDLTQYTLALDRQNAALEEFLDTHHPAVLALVRMTVENAHAQGIWAGICGELGADPTLTELFLEMGCDELSVSPGRVLELRAKICESEV